MNPPIVDCVIDGVQEVYCYGWDAFARFFGSDHSQTHGIIWRGHAHEEWILESSLERSVRRYFAGHQPPRIYPQDELLPAEVVEEQGARAFDAVTEVIKTAPESHLNASMNEMDVWALGRHHGLRTPLVDWSKSPYVAAFFAFSDLYLNNHIGHEPQKHAVLWGLDSTYMTRNEINDAADSDYFFGTWHSSVSANRRMVAQQGMLSFVWPPIPLLQLVRRRRAGYNGDAGTLIKVIIPQENASHFLVNLNRMNINFRTLYPDLAGASMHGNLNLELPHYEGRGNWKRPPGFTFLEHHARLGLLPPLVQ